MPTDNIPDFRVQLLNPTIALDPFRQAVYAAFIRKEVWLEHFRFDLEWNTLAASAVGAIATVTIDPGIDYILLSQNLVAYTAADTIEVDPDYVLEMQERAGNTNWSDTTVHVGNVTGGTRAGVTGELDFPRYIRGNNTLQAKLTNRSTTAAKVNMDLGGIRVTYREDATRQRLFGVV
jgi:hypothetical protein